MTSIVNGLSTLAIPSLDKGCLQPRRTLGVGKGSIPIYYGRSCEDYGEGRPWEEMGQFFALVSLMLPKAHSHNSYHTQKGSLLGMASGV